MFRSSHWGIVLDQHWYVLRSKPRKEESLFEYARSQGHEVFYPRIPVNPVNPRAATEKPFFPGYLFVHTCVDAVGQSEFSWMPFSRGLVRVGDEPAPIQETFVHTLQDRIDKIWEAGGLERVDFHSGDRVRVLLEMLNDRSVVVELDPRTISNCDEQEAA